MSISLLANPIVTFLSPYLQAYEVATVSTYTVHFTSTSTIKPVYTIPEISRYLETDMQKAMQHACREPNIPILRLAQLCGVD